MLPYLSIFALFGLVGLRDESDKARSFLIPVGLGLIWFMGLREFVGCDYMGYLNRYDAERFGDLGTTFRANELGFELITQAFAQSGASFFAFQAFVSAIIVICYLRFASRHPYPMLIVALMLPLLVVQLGMSGLRQAMAVGLVLLAFDAFIEKRRILTATWIIAAFLFHSSAIVFLPIAFIAGRQISLPRLIAAFAILAPVAAFLLGDRAAIYSNRYVEQIYGEQDANGAWFRYALSVIPTLFFLYHRERIKEAYPKQYQLLLVGALFVASLSLTALISTVALHRFNYYALPLAILMAVYGTKAVATRPASMRLAWLGIFGGYMLSWFLLSSHAERCYIPYQNITL